MVKITNFDKRALLDIINERTDQLYKHGITVEHDVKNNSQGNLLRAVEAIIRGDETLRPIMWNRDRFDYILSKPKRERLVIACALLAAEIDRMDYIEKHGNK